MPLNRVRDLRLQHDVSQAEMAAAIKVRRATVSEIERGVIPTGEVMLKVAAFFNKDARDIFFVPSVLSTAQEIHERKIQKRKERASNDSTRSKSPTS